MFVGVIENATSVANTNIPIRTELSTNRKIVNNTTSNIIEIRKPGIYKVDGYLQLIGIEGDVDVTILHDSSPVRTLTVTLASATTVVVVPLDDAFRCIAAQYPNVGNISIRLDTAGVTVDGLISVEYIQ
ncbi:MAG: hypothetical protein KBT35_01625 [Firmicutes bacterium]|nr:hypothetical protein [Candidatus Colivicinus equi]